MGVWWMEGNNEQSAKERMSLRLSTGAVAETVRLARDTGGEIGGAWEVYCLGCLFDI